MCEQTEVDYLDGDVVWVKLGNCWWPGEVVGPDKLPPDVLSSFRKPPIAVVKFFQESTYEYVKNINSIYKYNCSRKNEFINKGLYMYRTNKFGHMEKFPEDVIRAETAVGGDIEILTRDEFQEVKKERPKQAYAGLFGSKKGKGRGRPSSESPMSTPTRRAYKEKTDYKVHILVQGSKELARQSTDTASTPSTSRAGSEVAEDKPQKPETQPPPATVSTPTVSSAGTYACPNCTFSTTRLNVLILHNKTHSASYTPYTPSPVRKKPVAKSATKSTPKTSKTPKTPRPRKEKPVKVPKKTGQGKKRSAEEKPEAEVKKPKTEQEIKSSLLADWDDDDADDESNDESTGPLTSGSPEVPIGSESPAVPTPAELPSAQVPIEPPPVEKKPVDTPAEKPESSSDSKYEFCEDEDWPVEADAGRKIPRVKNPSQRKEDNKSLSLDEDDVAKEVAELLNKTAMPELPSVPEPLKVEENFPEPSIVKSPDKNTDVAAEPSKSSEKEVDSKPTKAIFKTKTFFRSRHSRSQDAIGKYVAEQLNPERIELSENELNGSEAMSSPETRDLSPVEHVKVARLAPKIQLKKMKAEAAQLREKEKSNQIHLDISDEIKPDDAIPDKLDYKVDNIEMSLPTKSVQDVIYPIQEIKPINSEQIKIHKTLDKEEHNAVVVNQQNDDVDMELSENGKASDIKDTFCEPDNEEPIDSPSPPKPDEPAIEKADNFEKYEMPVKSFNEISIPDDKNEIENSIDNMKAKSSKNLKLEEILSPTKISPQKTTHILSLNATPSPKNLLAEINENTPSKYLNVPSSQKSPIQLSSDVTSPKKNPITTIQKAYEQMMEPYMNESTASAVDALLSVSREADRVPKIVGSGPPEDLFEDDIKDTSIEEIVNTNPTGNGIDDHHEIENEKIDQTIEESNKVIEESTQVIEESNKLIEESTRVIEESTRVIEESDKVIEEPSQVEVVNENYDPVIQPNDTSVATENHDVVTENMPSESDLQIAETLLNLPATAIQNTSNAYQESVPMAVDDQHLEETIVESGNVETDVNTYETTVCENVEHNEVASDLELTEDKNLNIRYETELEKSENLNAAQSLVQMSETIDHKMNIVENSTVNTKINKIPFNANKNNGIDAMNTVEQNVEILTSNENNNDTSDPMSPKFETSSSKLLKILEEPITAKPVANKTTPIKQTPPVKQLVVTGKEKILNFDVAKSALKSKSQAPKQKIIIRRSGTGKSFLNNLSDVVSSPDKIILSRSNVAAQDGSSVQTFTIQASPDTITSSDPKQIIIQPKLRKVAKPPVKLQKIKPQNSLVQLNETKTINETAVTDETMFDINSMPVVLSDDILTPESIEKMPIVMSDGNIIQTTTPNPPPKLVQKAKPTIVENEKIAISASPSKSEVRTLLVSTASEVNKVTTTPNILSKSAKLRGAKPMLVIDKTTGKQKIIMTKGEPTLKEIKPTPTIIQPALPQVAPKTEKFIILPTGASPRPGRTQKIVIDPTTGKAHVLVAKNQEQPISVPENKPVSAKLIPSSSDANSPGNTVMIITNAQGAQSRIVLTPEHEKILFPNKQPNVSQLKTITQRITTNAAPVAPKTIVTAAAAVKTPTRILPKQKSSAIITSKGQLIVGGRVATTAQNIAPIPEMRAVPKNEIRTVPKRIVASEPKKLVQAIQKNTSEPLIFLQQKNGAVMQLTAAQFEHLQRTGQIIQKAPAPENKIVVQKSITISPKDTIQPQTPKQRVRKTATASPTPAKKVKHEIVIAPAPSAQIAPPVPPLTSISNTSVPAAAPAPPTVVPSVSNTVSVSSSTSYGDLDNFEELLPSTAIVRPPEVVAPAPPPPPAPEEPPAQLSDGQLLAVPGENFGGPPGSFYLCVEDNGTLTPIDNRPLVLENNQLVPMAVEPLPVFPQPERRDILEAALANSDVFHAEPPRDEVPDFRDLNANVSVHCRVSETSTTLHQPIMTPVEVPSKADSEPAVPANLEDGLAVIGVTPHTVPTSLELPITVTDPRIAPKTRDPLSNYGTTLLTSPNTDMTFVTEETEMSGPMSMPLLTDDDGVGKSMPILTDEGERGASSVESPAAEVGAGAEAGAGAGAGGGWARLLHDSDASELSNEIPLQPPIQLSINELSRHS